jgi:hypothetical protein
MKRLLLVAVIVAMTLCLSGTAVLAASPSGRGTTTIRYQSAEYYDFVIGATVVCKGIHQYGPRWPGDVTSGGRDVYRCRSLSGPFTNVQHDDRFVYPAHHWVSDYFFDHQGGIFVFTTRPMRLHVAGNNLSYQAIAYYAEP